MHKLLRPIDRLDLAFWRRRTFPHISIWVSYRSPVFSKHSILSKIGHLQHFALCGTYVASHLQNPSPTRAQSIYKHPKPFTRERSHNCG
ncbi:Uncharacterized protein HZ326_18979 [Fusarium oxysporum f. sp. albedinis]|nr:Uncharacterized protein HZ326_18979 [Fusarium oxysporum f. sp. albedinis]